MKRIASIIVFSLLFFASASAQSDPPPRDTPRLEQAELDQMLAPIALYPDALLSQILMASTYPLEVVEAARWSQAHPELTGDAAVRAAADNQWDPSVASLVAFPQVLQSMDQNLDWTERLGDAFLAQQAQVMDTIQNLRHKAQVAGNLGSNTEVTVREDHDAIDIEPADPEIIYVPYYDPSVVYGSWWWPDYPPVFWEAWPGYDWYGNYAWGIGFGIGGDFFFGGWDWHHHHVFVRDHRHWFQHHHGHGAPPESEPQPWQHDPSHRHGAPYRNAALSEQFGRASDAANVRQQPGSHRPPTTVYGPRVVPTRDMQSNPRVQQHAPPHQYAPAPQRHVPMQQHVPVQQHVPAQQRAPMQQRTPAQLRVPAQEHAPVKQHSPVRQHSPAS